MEYPRLLIARTCVWRTPGELQVGGTGRVCCLSEVPPQVAAVIPLFDGHHDLTRLREVCEEPWLTWVVSALDSLGCLAEGPAQPRPPRLQLIGEGLLASMLQDLLPPPVPADRSLAAPLHIVAPRTIEADRVMVSDLVARRIPHLLVRIGDDHACVGPFVIPGRTSCLTCVDLARRDIDPSWPVQAFQLAQIPSRAHPALCAWAAATATAHIRAWAKGFPPESMSTTVELSSQDGRVTYRRWPRRRSCSHCGPIAHADHDEEAADLLARNRVNASRTVSRSVVIHQGGIDATRKDP